MEKVKQIAEKYSDKLKYLLLFGACIGLINTFCRADYNFIIYLYMFYVWTFMKDDLESQAREKVTFFYILCYSFIIDIIWCILWKSKWNLLKEDIESGTHGLVLFLSWIGIITKVFVGLIIAISEKNILKGSLPKALSEKLNSGYLPQLDDDMKNF
jgi:small-conductance mechanosensitive channel